MRIAAMFARLRRPALAVCVTLLAGCGSRQVGEGTPGVLRNGDEPVGNVRVMVNRVEKRAIKPIGFGITADDGTFELMANAGHAGLRLPPGDYCCTLKSVGALVRIPNELAQVNSTPLKISWSVERKSLDLDVRGASISPSRVK